MRKGIVLALLSVVAVAALVPATGVATQECLPAVVCMGDSGADQWAHCDGEWADLYAAEGYVYGQICRGYDGVTHVLVCENLAFGCGDGALVHRHYYG